MTSVAHEWLSQTWERWNGDSVRSTTEYIAQEPRSSYIFMPTIDIKKYKNQLTDQVGYLVHFSIYRPTMDAYCTTTDSLSMSWWSNTSNFCGFSESLLLNIIPYKIQISNR